MKTFIFFVLIICLVCLSGCRYVVFVSGRTGNDQIFKMRTSGASQVNLSNNTFRDHTPDVSPDGSKIAFSSSRNGVDENIFVMDIHGGNVRQLTHGSGQRRSPKWSDPRLDLIAFAYPAMGPNTKIWTIQSDGTGLHQVTSPGDDESDSGGHDFCYQGKLIVFSRYNKTRGDRDLYTVNTDGTQNFERRTDTPGISETLPVVSHDGTRLAYRVSYHDQGRDAIRIEKVSDWSLVREINMQPPADRNICGIDFSADDTRLFVGIQSSDVPGALIDIKSEIFSIKTDGTMQTRLTDNNASDCYPVSVPGRGR